MGSDSEEVQQQVGCGSSSGIDLSQITLNINTTTGGSFSVNVDSQISVENLKKIIAKKLKVAKDRICLLHREKVLLDGTSVKENGILDGSRIILLPNVETGLLAQRPENTVMQALESLNDSQVNDFLSGKTPLNLSMRLGDHMMLIQLQLSTVNPTGSSSSASTSGTSLGPSAHSPRDVAKHLKHMKNLSNLNLFGNRSKTHSSRSSLSSHQMSSPIKFSNVTATGGECSTSSTSKTSPSKNNLEDLSQIVNALEKVKQRQEIPDHNMDTSDTEQSPIKSLSNLVSSPLNASSLKSIHLKSTTSSKSTSCQCKATQNTDSAGIGCDMNCQYSQTYSQVAHKRAHFNQSELKNLTRSSAFLHKTINNPISKTRSFNYSSSSQQIGECSASTAHIRRSKSSESITNQEQGIAKMLATKLVNKESVTDQPISIIDATAGSSIDDITTGTTETLAEASRNLTKTLRKLSKEVFSTKGESSVSALQEEKRSRTSSSTNNVQSNSNGSQQNSSANSGIGSGAVIESMRNHGRGIYSGTFSGTLNPALQDRFGRPKRDISTVIHILNDLLSATPHYSRGARISFEPAHSSRSSKYASSSKRSSGSGSSMSQPSHSRSQCTKCSPLSKRSGECSADCIRAHRSSGSRSASTIVTNDLKHRITTKSASLPTTPISKLTSIDCRQCQMPLLSNSAPVTPTKESANQIAHLNKSDISLLSNTSLDSSNVLSNLDFRNSSNDLSMCSPLLANAMNQSTISTNSPICTKCSNMEIENNKTKTKLDQLRLVMQQRRERREARKLRSAPYGGRIIGAAATATTSNSSSNPTNQNDSANNGSVISASVDGLPSNPIVEQVNTLA